MTSSKTSTDSGTARSWTDNWILLRQLWPDWSPTDEQVREIWLRSFDRPHGVSGRDFVNQDALHEAIVAHNRSSRWKEPRFLEIADAYRRERTRVIVRLDKEKAQDGRSLERRLVDEEHQRRLDRISEWSTERLLLAQERVARLSSTFRGKSSDSSTWSAVYTGLLVAADEAISGGDS